MTPIINYNPDFLYVLIDLQTNGILWAVKSEGAAQAMMMWSSRIRMLPVETFSPWLKKDLKEFNYQDLTLHKRLENLMGRRNIVDLSPDIITDEYIAFRQEVALRSDFHSVLLTTCNLAMRSVPEHPLLVTYADSIMNELKKCDPETETYSDAIKGYAAISKISNAAAVQELDLHMENLAHVRMRNMAIYLKYRNQLNEVGGNREEQKAVMGLAIQQLYHQALV